MYSIKPFVDFSVAPALPTAMYHVKPIYHDSELPQVTGGNAGLPSSSIESRVADLQARQEVILKKIAGLTEQANKLSSALGAGSISSSSSSAGASGDNKLTPFNSRIVIVASPRNPPHAVFLVLDRVLSSSAGAHLTVHTHSSVKVNAPTHPLNALLAKSNEKAPVKFTFIWSESARGSSSTSEPTAAPAKARHESPIHSFLILSPRAQSVIYGDACIVRYLTRQFLPQLYPETSDPLAAIQIDDLLHEASAAAFHPNAKEAGVALKNLETKLAAQSKHASDSHWLVGNRLTLADFAVAGSLHSQDTKSLSSLPHVSKWLAFARTSPEFRVLFA